MTLHCAVALGSLRVPCAALHGQVVVVASLEGNKKGFGSNPGKDNHKPKKHKPKQAPSDLADRKAVLLKEGSQELRSVIKSVEKGNSKMKSRQFKIDKDVAAKGKVDFVKVESWESAEKDQAELDNLKVRSFSPAFSFSDHNVPFYERLVRRLELLESKGDISVVQVKSLPPFQEWIFGEKRYLQYLVDQHAVFEALRNAISSLQNLKSEVSDSSETTTDGSVVMAVATFGDSLGLNRSQALWNDIEELSRTMTAKNNGIISELPKSTTQTTAYVKYLKHLSSLSSDEKDWKRACLQLIAHVFAVYVAHLTTGMRIGAKALDHIPLVKEAKAVSYYRDYPKHISDPLKAFITAVNKVPEFVVAQEDQESIMEELPKAIQKTSLLLSVLAVKEQLDQNEFSTQELAV